MGFLVHLKDGSDPRSMPDRVVPDSEGVESKIELGEDFFNEVIRNPVPLDMHILKRLSRSPLGLDLYLWLTYRTFTLKRSIRLTWTQLYRQFGVDPAKANDARTVDNFRTDCLRELKTAGHSLSLGHPPPRLRPWGRSALLVWAFHKNLECGGGACG